MTGTCNCCGRTGEGMHATSAGPAGFELRVVVCDDAAACFALWRSLDVGSGTMARIVITGHDARDIADRVRTSGRLRPWWTEVQCMDECEHGCKLYVRTRGAVTQYQLCHSTIYGCALGRDKATRDVPVSVRPAVRS